MIDRRDPSIPLHQPLHLNGVRRNARLSIVAIFHSHCRVASPPLDGLKQAKERRVIKAPLPRGNWQLPPERYGSVAAPNTPVVVARGYPAGRAPKATDGTRLDVRSLRVPEKTAIRPSEPANMTPSKERLFLTLVALAIALGEVAFQFYHAHPDRSTTPVRGPRRRDGDAAPCGYDHSRDL